jgi:hypothetical protein
LTRWVNNFPQKYQFKSFDQRKLTLIFSPYKPELSMIRSCPNRQKVPSLLFNTHLVMWKYNCEPLWLKASGRLVSFTHLKGFVFNDTFNNISFISWRSVLLVEETRVHGENHRPAASHWQTLSDNAVSSTHRHERASNSQHQWW